MPGSDEYPAQRDAVALLEAVLSLRQRKWERCKRGKCEQDECASDDLRFNGGVLFFHGVVLRVLGEFSEAIRCVYKCAYIVGNMLVAKNTKGRQDFFYIFFRKTCAPGIQGCVAVGLRESCTTVTGKSGDAAVVSVVGTYVFVTETEGCKAAPSVSKTQSRELGSVSRSFGSAARPRVAFRK